MRLLVLAGLVGLALAQARSSNKKVVVENGAICENKASAFFVIDNTQLTAGDNVIYKEFSEEECMNTCSNNRDPFGRSVLCSAFVYDHVSFTCTVYKDKSKPEGTGDSSGSVGKRYFEKFCLAEDLPMECADAQFIRADASVLVGYATNVSLTETLEECVATCVKDKACKSAMFFYEEGECITNSESALTQPDRFAKEETEKVIYFQNGCIAKQLAQKAVKKSKDAKAPASTTIKPKIAAPAKKEEDAAEYDSPVEGSGAHSEESSEELVEGEEYDEESSTEAASTEAPMTPASKDDESSETTTEAKATTVKSQETTAEKEDEDDEEEAEENEEEVTTPAAAPKRKLGDSKAQYIKYKKHPRNFASKTVKASKEGKKAKKQHKDEALEDEDFQPAPVSAATQEEEQNDELSQEEMKKDEEEFLGGDELPQGEEGTSKKHNLAIKPLKIKEEQIVAQNYFSEWADWTPCTKTGERRVRRRKCLDLRKCLGALMQVENCPAVTTTPIPDDYDLPPLESVRSIVSAPTDVDSFADQGAHPVQLPAVSADPSSVPAHVLPEGSPTDTLVWSPWLGVCQQFASGQPCNNGEMIGFESRECIAKDPVQCEGPFFRYCTLNC